ncbi:ty3-gypsy retrotransposon protein [Cucumis melo var. makuwa]|uniref:Ty3-gypsy retrotransposon protein n=1 Tax=Cucumis melo var. makuwa TaxID=1194695 RepID=A0A5A7URA8_CUCMM|nr:ty3-gypsy retrotransposon protein [Cucumis melo var. makuwa]TYK01517.1 ty3-gypsy retrotransposon protein [Cucumis melo var. makuwa]
MLIVYQPPKFQQFDGKGNPKQHIAYFVETCENAGSRGDQFVRYCRHARATTEEAADPVAGIKYPAKITKDKGVSEHLSRFNLDDLLSLPQETKTILINTLLDSRATSSSAPIVTYESTPYCMSIDFSDEDLLLGSKLHNRPLYVSGYVREQRVDRILIDNGSGANIILKSTMRQLGILMDKLLNSKLVVQGFN